MKSFFWPTNISDAKAIQISLRDKVKIIPLKKPPQYIASVDASFTDDEIIAVTCIYKYPELVYIGHETAIKEATFPYVPGYLTFREGPAIIEAINSLSIKPDLILVDGQGIAHPKGIGIASHIGVLLDMPTIGCAKSRLIGEYKESGFKKGDWSSLEYNGRAVGAVLRTKENVRPLFVSPGHKIDLKASIEIVLGCTSKYRIPDPLRMADFISKKIKREIFFDSSKQGVKGRT
ncbi:MAG: deoxyribonuclease V [Nitrospirota bacterium]|nr:deoxyribonuclease V [Nitrospirota bacterium]